MSRLHDILGGLRPEKTNRLRVIILCVFAATTFWILNALNENYSTTLKYPLQFVYDEESYIALQELPEEVQVNVTGLGWNLFRNSLGIKVTPLRIVLENPSEVKKISSGALPALIADQMNEVELNYVLTDSLNINIDQRIRRKFALAIDSSSISLDENYRIVSPIRFSPDSVDLNGPQSILNSMPDTVWVKIPQEEISRNYKETVPINTPDNRLISRDPASVNVVFNVEEFVPGQQKVPLQTENFPEDGSFYIRDNTIPVKYYVNQDRQDDIHLDDFEMVVDFKKLNPNDSTIMPVIRRHPSFLVDVAFAQDSVKVKVHYNEE